MIRESAVAALDGLVGFRQPIDTDYALLDTGNLASLGLYFEDATGIVTVKHIIDTYEEETLTDPQFNTVLDNLRASAARDVLNKIFEFESHNRESKILFPYEEDFINTHDLVDDFYYIEFTPTIDRSIVTALDNIWLSFDGAETFNIYLYHSKKIAPIETQSVTTVAGEATKVYLGWNLDDTGTYRLGYKSADVGTSKPFKRDYSLASVERCSNSGNINFYSSDFLANGRIDVNNQNSLEDGHGMNVEFSSFIDWTYEIIKNKDRFARALQLQLAITVSDRILTTDRSNVTERFTTDDLTRLDYILGNEDRGTGLKGQFRKEIRSIKEFFFPRRLIKLDTIKYGIS